MPQPKQKPLMVNSQSIYFFGADQGVFVCKTYILLFGNQTYNQVLTTLNQKLRQPSFYVVIHTRLSRHFGHGLTLKVQGKVLFLFLIDLLNDVPQYFRNTTFKVNDLTPKPYIFGGFVGFGGRGGRESNPELCRKLLQTTQTTCAKALLTTKSRSKFSVVWGLVAMVLPDV